MLFVCNKCGMANCFAVNEDRQICRNCGNTRSFKKRRLLLLTGPQGAGKTAVSEVLQRKTTWLILEGDILRPSGLRTGTKERECLKTWLKICLEANQTVDTVVLCGNWSSGMIASCSELAYFSEVVLAVLLPSETFMAENQEKRPAYRNVSRLPHARRIYRKLDRSRYLHCEEFRGVFTVLKIDQPLGTPEDTAEYIIQTMNQRVKQNGSIDLQKKEETQAG